MDRTVIGLVGFARALRHSGMACGPSRVQAFLDAAEEVGLDERDSLYWAGRLTLCSDPDDIPRYDTAFGCWFGHDPMPSPQDGHAVPRPARIAALTSASGESDEGAEPLSAAASEAEVLRRRDFAELGTAEREHLRRLLAVLRPDPPQRPALRRAPSRRGQMDARATLRELLRTAGEPLRLPRRSRARRPRRVVLLIDVSGSMAPYADSLLRFAHVVVRRSPASTEVFTLGTRMTRVSRQLRQRDPEQALDAAARAVPDFSGGTRLGETLRAFLDRWGQRGVARGAVVVLFSDGWERGDVSVLAEQMRRLRRLTRSVIWANPHAGHEGYEPVQSGIVAAMPHVDGMVAGHSLRALEEIWARVLDR
ncbi:VWA domain-containing protein [Saccharopolyspora erythraea]|uniref:vWA domain-containing protein n=1 Tax=Saccharopolyspora erythraea TaxID=1836 RepID=UPI001BA93734|nr:VWA domain-containing protein [Saccharopolyspora erythraea]QUG99883.1 VWA domain-containing protein [Saccharopolyspora erythraea]